MEFRPVVLAEGPADSGADPGTKVPPYRWDPFVVKGVSLFGGGGWRLPPGLILCQEMGVKTCRMCGLATPIGGRRTQGWGLLSPAVSIAYNVPCFFAQESAQNAFANKKRI